MDGQRIKEVLADEAFVKELLAMETPTEVQTALKEKGVELSEDEVTQIATLVNQYIESGAIPEELSLEQLEDVSGGMAIEATLFVALLIVGAVVGAGGVTGGFFLGRFLAKLRW